MCIDLDQHGRLVSAITLHWVSGNLHGLQLARLVCLVRITYR
jgi:hypothetical protein